MHPFVFFFAVLALTIQDVSGTSLTNEGWVESGEALHPRQETKFYVFLKQRNIPVLEDIFWDVSNPLSPNYGKYLSQQQIADVVAPDDHVIQEVRKWIDSVPHIDVGLVPHRDAFIVRSTVDSTERLFTVKLSQFRHTSSEWPIARSSARISLPPNVAQHVGLVTGINNFPFVKSAPPVPQPSVSQRSVLDSNAPIVNRTDGSPTELELFALFDPYCYDGSVPEAGPDQVCSGQLPAITGFYLYSVPPYATPADTGVTNISLAAANCGYYGGHCGYSFTGLTSSGAPTPLPYVYYNVTIQTIYEGGLVSNNGSFAFLAVSTPTPDPSLIKSHYGIPPNSTVTNETITQSIVSMRSSFNLNDLFQFLSQNNLPNASVSIIGINNQTTPGEESSLDMEQITSIAPGSPTLFFAISPGDGLVEWATEINSLSDPPLVHSISYGRKEKLSDAQLQYYQQADSEFMKMGTRGLTILVASGDSGASELDAGGTCSTSQPIWPASSPYVTTVGGTIFAKFTKTDCFEYGVLDCSNDAVGEIVASSTTDSSITSGGGFSNIYPRPSFQASFVSQYLNELPTPINASFANTSNRGYPDVSAVARDIPVFLAGENTTASGTSASTPIVAGIVTLLNSVRANAGLPPIGFLNPLLYQIASDHPDAFYDVTYGDNRCGNGDDYECCPVGYSASSGWDPVTGLGTINYAVFAAVITSYSPIPPSNTTQEFTSSSSSSTSGSVSSSTTGNLTTTTSTGVAVNTTTTATSTSGGSGIVGMHVLLLPLSLLVSYLV